MSLTNTYISKVAGDLKFIDYLHSHIISPRKTSSWSTLRYAGTASQYACCRSQLRLVHGVEPLRSVRGHHLLGIDSLSPIQPPSNSAKLFCASNEPEYLSYGIFAMSMITATAWVPRGFAAQFPTRHQLNEEEYDRISKLSKLQLDDAKEDLKDALEGGEEESDGGVAVSKTNG